MDPSKTLGPSDQLAVFIFQVCQLIPVPSLSWPRSTFLIEDDTQFALLEQLFRPANLLFPFPHRYEIPVLKELIRRLESALLDPETQEVHGDLYARLSDLMAEPLTSESSNVLTKSHVTYAIPFKDISRDYMHLQKTLTLTESNSVISAVGTTGLRTWEAALRLTTWLSRSRIIRGKNIIELGAGTGLVSIICSKFLAARYVIASDGDSDVVNTLDSNIIRAGLIKVSAARKSIDSMQIRWGENTGDLMSPTQLANLGGSRNTNSGSGSWDLVLAADVTYDSDVIPLLARTIKDLLLAFPQLQVIMSATIRNEETFALFPQSFGT
ncbi:MAG: hypothetical protein M1814_000774 [Vezdaea aestivalis]|nr:MAG: hypothetical protein M1814_000774 [Vezdaea aestivalis]